MVTDEYILELVHSYYVPINGWEEALYMRR